MRRFSMTLTAVFVCIACVAQAQTPAAAALSRRFLEMSVGPTFGHKTDLAVGGEGSVPVGEDFDVFAEGGWMRNVSTSALDAAATVIAQFISGTGATKQSVRYFDVGVRYVIPTSLQFDPYVSLGLGAARVARSATFTVGGADVTSQLLDRFGVQLGTDLSKTETKALVAFGIGAHLNVSKSLIGDVSYRYGRIFLTERGLNANRLQFGIGVRF